MFQNLIDLFSGWYFDYVEAIRDLISYTQETVTAIPTENGTVTEVIENTINPAIWSAYVPWEQIIASVTLIVFVVCIFKLMRSFLCKIL